MSPDPSSRTHTSTHLYCPLCPVPPASTSRSDYSGCTAVQSCSALNLVYQFYKNSNNTLINLLIKLKCHISCTFLRLKTKFLLLNSKNKCKIFRSNYSCMISAGSHINLLFINVCMKEVLHLQLIYYCIIVQFLLSNYETTASYCFRL